jgi:hypothetical protein
MGGEREAGHHTHHREEKATMVWPRQEDARGENTKINPLVPELFFKF